MIGRSKFLFFVCLFNFSIIKLQAQQKGFFFPENLLDLKEFISKRYFGLFSESPYEEFEKYLFSAEKLIEMGLFKEAEKDLEKAEKILQVVWSIERREKGISRTLPTKEEFSALSSKQKAALESYLRQKLGLVFLKEELLSQVYQKDSFFELAEEIQKLWQDYFMYFEKREDSYLSLVLLKENTFQEKMLIYLPKEKKNELPQRLVYRRLLRLFLNKGDVISAYFVYQEYVKLIEKNVPPLAEARYLILFGQLVKAVNILSENLKSEIEDFADFYVQYEMRILRIRLLLVLSNLEKAKNELLELKNFLENFAQKAKIPKEVFYLLEEKRYTLLLEFSALKGDFGLEAPNPAFSQEIQVKFSWFQNKKTADFWQYQNELFPFWEFDQNCFAQKNSEIYFFADWAFRLVFYTHPHCSWPVFEKQLVQRINQFPKEIFFKILEERFQMEKNQFSLNSKNGFLTFFFRYYLLGERGISILPVKSFGSETKDSLLFYESPFYLIAFNKENYFFWEKNEREIDITEVFRKIQIFHNEVWLKLYGDAHRLPFEEFFSSEKVFVFRQLWQEPVCEICQKNSQWYAFGMRQERAIFFAKKEAMDDIFAAFSQYSLLSVNEKNFFEKIKEKALRNELLLLHLLGQAQLKDNSLPFYLQEVNIFDLSELQFLPNLGGVVFQDEQKVDLYSYLAILADLSGVDFLILVHKKYGEDFSVSFFYDLYYRLVRKKIKPNLAFKESYLRYIKTLGEKKIPPVMVFYGRP